MSAEFDSSVEALELILLSNNPFSIPRDARLVFDTRAKNAKAGDISDCAKVSRLLFLDVEYEQSHH